MLLGTPQTRHLLPDAVSGSNSWMDSISSSNLSMRSASSECRLGTRQSRRRTRKVPRNPGRCGWPACDEPAIRVALAIVVTRAMKRIWV
jgi:hypothetical protein